MDTLSALAASPLYQGMAGGIFGTLLAQQDMQGREIELGGHIAWTGISHIGRANITISLAAFVFEISTATVIPMQMVAMAAVGLAHYLGENSENIHEREWAHFVVDLITPVTRVANIVITMALFYFGNIVMGSAICIMYGMALLDKAGYMPEIVQKVYYHVLLNDYFLAIGSCIITSGVSQFFCIVMLAARIGKVVESWMFSDVRHTRELLNTAEPGRLTQEQFVSLMTSDDTPLEIDPTSIYKTVPDYRGPTPEIDYKRVILGIFDEISVDERVIRTVTSKVGSDERFRQANERERTTPVAFARKSLETLMDHVRNHDFAAGVSIDYQVLERQLKIVVQYLHDHKGDQAIFVQDTVLKLAIEGGGYCQAAGAPSIRQNYRNVVFELCMRDVHMPENQKLKLLFYQVLATMRETIFQKLFFNEQMRALYGDFFVDQLLSNRHMYNTLVELYGEPFGLVTSGSEDDIVAVQAGNDPGFWLMQKIFAFVGTRFFGISFEFKELMKTFFFDQFYTTDSVAETLQQSTSLENRAPVDNIRPWLEAWINSRWNEDERDGVLSELADMPEDYMYNAQTLKINSIQVSGQRVVTSVQVPEMPLQRADESDREYRARRSQAILNAPRGKYLPRERIEANEDYVNRIVRMEQTARNLRDTQNARFFKAMAFDMGILRVRQGQPQAHPLAALL